MTTRRTTDNTAALHAFLAAKIEIDAMLERLKTLSDGHFDTHPDEINWGHVGSLNHYVSLLRQSTDSAFSEGEQTHRSGLTFPMQVPRPVARHSLGLGCHIAGVDSGLASLRQVASASILR